MNFKRRANQESSNEFETSYDREMSELAKIGSLTDEEVDFLMMKKMRNKARFYAPDPGQGEYEYS
jgi:hypothetical protein